MALMGSTSSTIILIVFFLMNIFLLIKGQGISLADKESSSQGLPDGESASTFKFADYFLLDHDIPFLKLKAEVINLGKMNQVIEFVSPDGIYFSKQNGPISYQAIYGKLDKIKNYMNFLGKVKLHGKDSEITSNIVFYDLKNEVFNAKENVLTRTVLQDSRDVIIVNSDELESWPEKKESVYKGNVNGQINRERSYEPSTHFEAETIFIELNKGLVRMEENVKIQKLEMVATANNGEIYLENYNKKLKYFVLNDDVRLKEKIKRIDGQVIERRGFAERLVAINKTKKIYLTGLPKIVQENEVITGSSIAILENNEVVEVDDANSSFDLK